MMAIPEAVTAARRPLSAQHLRMKEQLPLAAAPAIGRLATRLPETVAGLFGDQGAAALRVTVERVQDETLALPEEGRRWLALECPAGPLRMLLVLDRVAVFALCEAAMGGSGTEPPFADGERPLSRIEKGLRDGWLSRCGAALAGLLTAILGQPVTSAGGPPDDAGTGGGGFDATVLRLLVNLFGYSGELVIAFDRPQLRALLAAADAAQPDATPSSSQQQVLQQRLAGAQARIEVALPPETMCVEDIASLRPGALLKLQARLSGPVIVSSAGQRMFTGLLEPSADRLAVKLLDPIS